MADIFSTAYNRHTGIAPATGVQKRKYPGGHSCVGPDRFIGELQDR